MCVLVILAGAFVLNAAPSRGQGVNDIMRLFTPGGHPPGRPDLTYESGQPGVPSRAPSRSVQRAQSLLNDLGYDAGPADGALGGRTLTALNAFQRDNGLPETRTIDRRTLTALQRAARNGAPPPSDTGPEFAAEPSEPPAEADQVAEDRSPSFDCRSARLPSEKAICASPSLSGLDRTLDKAYRAAMASAPDTQAGGRMRNEQRSWILQRQRCERNVECLESVYRARLAVLSGDDGLAAPPAGSNGGEVAGGPATRPLTIVRVDGVPVISPEVSPHGATLLHLAAYAASPGLIDENRTAGGMSYASQLALDVLPMRSPEMSAYLNSSSFRGADEFEQAATRERFFAEYGPKMRAMAPKPPFRLALAQAGRLSRYDEARKGFRLGEAPNYLAGHYYTDFLTPRSLRQITEPEMFWPLSEAEAKEELRKLAADAGNPSAGRDIYKVAIVDVTSIDATTRTADVVLRGYEVYDGGFGRKLFSIPVEAPADGAPEATRGGPEAFAKLLNLPEGFKRWTVDFRGGIPMFREDQRDDMLFASVRESVDPGFLEKNPCVQANLLTERTRARYMLRCDSSNGPTWMGSDEFERAEAAAAFKQRDIPKVMAAAAPGLPFRFSYVDDVQLAEYSADMGGFASRWQPPSYQQGVSTDLGRQRRGYGDGDSLVTDYPQSLVKMPLGEARALAGEMANWRFKRQGGNGQEQLGGRWLRRLTTYEVMSYEPKTGGFSLMVKAMALYDGAMKRKIYDFPIAGDDLPLQIASVPAKLVTAAPAPFDLTYLTLIGLDAASPEQKIELLSHFRSIIRERDSGYYRDGSKTPPQFAPDDARRPFYTRDSLFAQRSDEAQFKAFAEAVRAGLPDEVVLTSEVHRGNIRAGYAFGAGTYLGNRLNPGELREAMGETGLQTDQVFKKWAGKAHFIVALPNDEALYSVPADLDRIGRLDEKPITQTARFKVGSLRLLASQESGSPVFLLPLEPLSISVSHDGQTLAERSFDDVPRLDGAGGDGVPAADGTAPVDAGEAADAAPAGPVPLTAQTADLLAVALAGDALPEDALAYRVLRRWQDERGSEDPFGGRFFTVGRRSPTVEEARALVPKLVAFARQKVGTSAVRVMLEGKAVVAASSDTGFWPWAMMRCFGGQDMPSALADAKWREPSTSLKVRKNLAKMGGTSRWTPDDERKLAASTARGKATDYVHDLAGDCRGKSLSVGLSDRVVTYVTIPVNLPAPPQTAIDLGREVTVKAEIEISAVRLQETRPEETAMLPGAITELLDARPASSSNPGQYLVFDAKLVQATYFDETGREVFRSSGDENHSIAAIVKSFEAETAAPSESPMFEFPHDIVGLRLGMSFEEAETVIRAHMKVAKVIDGRRGLDAASPDGFLRPATSGKLFVAEGEREFIAIIDEPPAVTGKVLVAWRRVYFEPGKVPEGEVIGSLQSKYGLPGSRTIEGGVRNYWSTPLGNGCQAQYQHGAPMTALGATWVENGAPFAVTMPDGAPVGDATLPMLVRQPQNPESRPGTDDCGPVFTAQFSFDASRTVAAGIPVRSLDWIEQILSNAGEYAEAFNANRGARQAGGGGGEAGGASKPSIKF